MSLPRDVQGVRTGGGAGGLPESGLGGAAATCSCTMRGVTRGVDSEPVDSGAGMEVWEELGKGVRSPAATCAS
jgi:hypothetical protein